MNKNEFSLLCEQTNCFEIRSKFRLGINENKKYVSKHWKLKNKNKNCPRHVTGI